MIIAHLSIGGTPIFDDVISIRVDQNDERSDADKFDIEIWNKDDKYTAKFSPNDKMDLDLEIKRHHKRGRGFIRTTQTDIIFRDAIAQDITYDYARVYFQGSDLGGTLADALPEEYASGQGKRISQIAREVCALHIGESITLVTRTTSDPITEKVYRTNWTFQEVLDDLADEAGAIWYTTCDGEVVFTDPEETEAYSVDDYIINANDRANCLGYCNMVCVVGGNTRHSPAEVGWEIQDHVDNVAWAIDEEGVDTHGPKVAPTCYAPHLTTHEQIQRHANNLLEWYKSRSDLAKPVLFGKCPPLRALITYSVGEITVTGIVKRRVIEWSVRGWYVTLEVETHSTNYVPIPVITNNWFIDNDFIAVKQNYLDASDDFLSVLSDFDPMSEYAIIFNPLSGVFQLHFVGNSLPSGFYYLFVWSNLNSNKMNEQGTISEEYT